MLLHMYAAAVDDIKNWRGGAEPFPRQSSFPNGLALVCIWHTSNIFVNVKLFLLINRNPALEQQAADRIHRLGQINDVTIHRS